MFRNQMITIKLERKSGGRVDFILKSVITNHGLDKRVSNYVMQMIHV